jgi:hypothetical protein
MKQLLLMTATAVCLSSVAAEATTIDLSYVGTPTYGASEYYGVTAVTGWGTATFATGLTSVTTSELSAFSFHVQVAGSNGTDVNNYTVSDISGTPGFTATLSATGQLLAASFTTPFQSGTGSYYYPAQDILAMTTDGPSGTGDSDVGPFSLGTFTASAEAVPEPTTIALFATGLLGLYRSRRRRR